MTADGTQITLTDDVPGSPMHYCPVGSLYVPCGARIPTHGGVTPVWARVDCEKCLAGRPDAPQPTPVPADAVVRAARDAVWAAVERHWPDALDGEGHTGSPECTSADDCVADVARAALAAARAGEADRQGPVCCENGPDGYCAGCPSDSARAAGDGAEVGATHPAHWERHGHPGEPCPPYGCYGGTQYGAVVDREPTEVASIRERVATTHLGMSRAPVVLLAEIDRLRALLAAQGDAAVPEVDREALSDAALVDLYWQTTGDDWAIPDEVMVKFGRAVLAARGDAAVPTVTADALSALVTDIARLTGVTEQTVRARYGLSGTPGRAGDDTDGGEQHGGLDHVRGRETGASDVEEGA